MSRDARTHHSCTRWENMLTLTQLSSRLFWNLAQLNIEPTAAKPSDFASGIPKPGRHHVDTKLASGVDKLLLTGRRSTFPTNKNSYPNYTQLLPKESNSSVSYMLMLAPIM